MHKPMITVSLLGLTALGWMQDRRRPVVPLGAAEMIVEWTPGQEAVVRISAESEEELECVRILRPDGRKLVDLDAQSGVPGSLSSLEVELREPSLERLIEKYGEGRYGILADTIGGKQALGQASLSFDLPSAARIVHPRPGQLLQSSSLTVLWVAAGHDVAAYELQLEQDEDDGLRVRLPPERSSFRVPPGILAPGTETALEIVAIGANGNRTVAEVLFTTQP